MRRIQTLLGLSLTALSFPTPSSKSMPTVAEPGIGKWRRVFATARINDKGVQVWPGLNPYLNRRILRLHTRNLGEIIVPICLPCAWAASRYTVTSPMLSYRKAIFMTDRYGRNESTTRVRRGSQKGELVSHHETASDAIAIISRTAVCGWDGA